MGRVDGKIVIVTGAAGGQGAADARSLAREGASVIATDLEPPRLEDGIEGRALDVTSERAWAERAAWAQQRYERVDGLVNNGGIAMRHRLADITLADLKRVTAVNVSGALLGIQTIAPLMRAGGSIVNISSVAGLLAYHGVGHTISKWGDQALSRSASLELGPKGIRPQVWAVGVRCGWLVGGGFGVDGATMVSAPSRLRAHHGPEVLHPPGRGRPLLWRGGACLCRERITRCRRTRT